MKSHPVPYTSDSGKIQMFQKKKEKKHKAYHTTSGCKCGKCVFIMFHDANHQQVPPSTSNGLACGKLDWSPSPHEWGSIQMPGPPT